METKAIPNVHLPVDSLVVTAKVAVINAVGVTVQTDSLDSALSVIRNRHHTTSPTMRLTDDTDQHYFTRGTWTITKTDVVPTDTDDITDYELAYSDFTIMLPSGQHVRAKSGDFGIIINAAQRLATQSGHHVRLESPLPGFIPVGYDPLTFTVTDAHTGEITTKLVPPPPTTPPPVPPPVTTSQDGRGHSRWNRLHGRFRALRQHARTIMQSRDAHGKKPRRKPRHRPPATSHARAKGNKPRKTQWLHSIKQNWGKPHTYTALAIATLLLLTTALIIGLNHRPATSSPRTLSETLSEPVWTLNVGADQQVAAYAAGIGYIDNQAFHLASRTTGKDIATVKLDEPITWTTELHIHGDPAVGVRTKHTFTLINAHGDQHTWKLDPETSVSATGTTPARHHDNSWELLDPSTENPKKLEVPKNYRLLGVDGDTPISASKDSPTIQVGEKQLDLTAPTEATWSRSVTAGHNWVVAEWSTPNGMILALHSLKTGKPSTTTPSQSKAFQRGVGLTYAHLGNTIVDLNNGDTIAVTGSHPQILGDAIRTDTDNGPVLTLPGKHTFVIDRNVLAVFDTTVVIRNNGTITAHSVGKTNA